MTFECPSSDNQEIEMWLSPISNRAVELEGFLIWLVCCKSLYPLTGCRCRTTASEGHAMPLDLILAGFSVYGQRPFQRLLRCGAARCLTSSLALPLESPKCISANTFLGLIQHCSSEGFRTLSTSISPASRTGRSSMLKTPDLASISQLHRQ